MTTVTHIQFRNGGSIRNIESGTFTIPSSLSIRTTGTVNLSQTFENTPIIFLKPKTSSTVNIVINVSTSSTTQFSYTAWRANGLIIPETDVSYLAYTKISEDDNAVISSQVAFPIGIVNGVEVDTIINTTNNNNNTMSNNYNDSSRFLVSPSVGSGTVVANAMTVSSSLTFRPLVITGSASSCTMNVLAIH